MAVVDLVEKGCIQVPLKGREKQEILRELVELLHGAGKIDNLEVAYSDILNREALGSTGLERGIAIPHAKSEGVTEMALAIGILPDGVDFDALDGNPSNLFFLILAPADRAGMHVEVLSEIARLTQSAAFCRLLLAAESPTEVVELFQED